MTRWKESGSRLAMLLLSVGFAIGVCFVMFGVMSYLSRHVEQSSFTKKDTVYVERIVEVRDSFPVERRVTVIGTIKVPTVKSELLVDSCKRECEYSDSVGDDLVQKKYSDDSTYTAYVSGMRYGDYPRLDSVIVSQKIVMRTITNTVGRRRMKFKVRPAVGVGYDPFNAGWGVYVGGAVVLDW